MSEIIHLKESRKNYLITWGDMGDYIRRKNIEDVMKANGGELIILASATAQNEKYIKSLENKN